MEIFDVAVIGAGPAGCMAAIQAASMGKKVVMLDKNGTIGSKLLLTGNGRCNITNSATIEIFMEKFGRKGLFYRDAFQVFTNHDLLNFFKNYDLDFKEESEGRIFPVTDKSKSVTAILEKAISELKIKVLKFHLKSLQKHATIFKLMSKEKKLITAYSVILATGGASYRSTGSSGDGFELARALGHNITELLPGEVPLTLRDAWTHELKGVTLNDVGLKIQSGGRVKTLKQGNILFTHFGISGPVILDMSYQIIKLLKSHDEMKLYIDFKPDLTENELESQLIADFQKMNKKLLKNYLNTFIPKNMSELVLENMSMNPDKRLNQITKKERLQLIKIIKSLPLTINGHLPLDNAMVTCGGVSQNEINPKTMESRLVPGLYFAGEIIDGCGGRGGFNLQQAFSTGYLAGKNASNGVL